MAVFIIAGEAVHIRQGAVMIINTSRKEPCIKYTANEPLSYFELFWNMMTERLLSSYFIIPVSYPY